MAETNMPADPSDNQIPLPVMGMTQREYQAAFTYLDDANLLREMEELDRKRRGLTVLEVPHVPWYNRPECWALILGALGLANGLFAQWVWPYLRVNPASSSSSSSPSATPGDGGDL